jgi:membrane protein
MYLSWVVILLGAEFAAAMPEWRASQARGRPVAGPGARLALALSLIARLREASRDGRKLRERRLSRGLPATPAEIDFTLRRLRRAGVVARTLAGGWVLSRDLSVLTLDDLADLLDLGLMPGEGWQPAAQATIRGLAAAGSGQMSRSLAELLDLHTEEPTL